MALSENLLARILRAGTEGSAELRELPDDLRRRLFFSARTPQVQYVSKLREITTQIADGRLSPQAGRSRLRAILDSLGYDPKAGGFPGWPGVPPATPGSLQDLSSTRRLNLIFDTNLAQAEAIGMEERGSTDLALFRYPAWQLIRVATRKAARDWQQRWTDAANAVGWEGVATGGEMIARKDSPIWEALGSGAGGHTDALNTPRPPFALQPQNNQTADFITDGLMRGILFPNSFQKFPNPVANT